ncbi:hypothetical protein V8C34DRAFT_324331 [Trichoderma compactum]
MSNPNDYAVGWICGIKTEFVAAQAVLDEKHRVPEMVSTSDNNAYQLGRIGKHNVVIAVLPDGDIRIGLLVGIGGGAPSPKHDIRLGDVVVSSPGSGNGGSHGGVFQYDFGETIQGQSFQTTGFLNQPPSFLRAAITGIKAKYEEEGHRIKANISAIFNEKPRLRGKYQQPDPSSDRLYQSHICHPINEGRSCAMSCGNTSSSLILRPERGEYEDDPMIHYGLIASANQLMKDAVLRDRLAAEKDVKCFETEAAGLMNHFPCLVIRGICDYSDSHKIKEWRGYSAMVAAMYTKDLLHQIPPNKIEAEKKIGDLLSEYRDISREHRDVAKEHRDITMEDIQTQEEERRRQEEEDCHQLFRLTRKDRDVTYEWYKDRVENRVEDTCLWFIQHEHFQTWFKQDSGPLLVSADPGCGKSVLAKYLVDEVLPQSGTTICYFFFKEQDQNTVRQALCALLHQLFAQKPCLIKHAIKEYRKNGPGLTSSTKGLWQILQDTTEDPQAESVIVVLDAVDECIKSEFTDLIRHVERQFCGNRGGRLKYLLTCRPYEAIISEFYNLRSTFPEIHIPGEEASEAISHEIDHVIQHRLDQLSKLKCLSANITEYLRTRLQEASHRTYLWVYLIFDYLEKETFKKTLKGVESILVTLPRSVNDAYERILSKSKQDPMVRKVLSIIFGARVPISLTEMNEAVNLEVSSRTIDLETDQDFKSRLRSWCGLFVSIHHDNVCFLHQTAREFLQQSAPPAIIPATSERWQHSISDDQADAVLAVICQAYLLYIHDTLKGDGELINPERVGECLNRHIFIDYAVTQGDYHIQKSRALEAAAFPGSAPLAAAPMEVSEKLNALATAFGDYYCWGSDAVIFDSEAIFIFNFAIWIATIAIHSLPQDHPSRTVMLSNYDSDRDPLLDSTEQLDSIFDESRKVLETTPRNHSDRENLLESLADGLRERQLRTTHVSDNLQAMAILGEIISTTPLDHPYCSILLNSLGDCLSKPCLISDREPKYGLHQAMRIVWKSVGMIPLDHPDRLIVLENITDDVYDCAVKIMEIMQIPC